MFSSHQFELFEAPDRGVTLPTVSRQLGETVVGSVTQTVFGYEGTGPASVAASHLGLQGIGLTSGVTHAPEAQPGQLSLVDVSGQLSLY